MSVEATMAINGAEQVIRAIRRPATDLHTMERFLVHLDDSLAELQAKIPGADSSEFGEILKTITVLQNVRYEVEMAISRRNRNGT